MFPQHSHAIYLDSGSGDKKKDYTAIKGVLDDALNDFAVEAGPGVIKKQKTKGGQLIWSHQTTFHCIKQPAGSTREAFYAMMHMWEFVKDEELLLGPADLKKRWSSDLANATDREIRLEFYRIQQKLAQVIKEDVITKAGTFYYGFTLPTNAEIEDRLDMQGDYRVFNTRDGIHPFPPIKPSDKPAKKK